MGRREKITFEMEPDEYGEMEEFIDNSLLFDNQSQFIRAAIRTMMDEEGDEFSGAR